MIASASVTTPTAIVGCFVISIGRGWPSICLRGTIFSGLLAIDFMTDFGEGGFTWSKRMIKWPFFLIF